MDDFIDDVFGGAFDDDVAESLETSKLKIVSEIKRMILSLEDNIKFKETRDYKNNLSAILSYLLEVNELADIESSGASENEINQKIQDILDRVIPVKNENLGKISDVLDKQTSNTQKIEDLLNNKQKNDTDDLFDF